LPAFRFRASVGASWLRRAIVTALSLCLLLPISVQASGRTAEGRAPRTGSRTAAPPNRPLAELAAGSAMTRHEIISVLRPGSGACVGAFQSRVVPAGGRSPCSHGPDTFLPNEHGQLGVPLGARLEPLPQFTDLPGVPCYSSGPRVHVFYAYFEKNLLDVAGNQNRRAAILNAVAVADRILSVSATQSGGVRHIRWVMNNCRLVITPFKLGPHFTFEAFDPTYLRFRLQRAGIWNRAEKGLTILETDTAPFPAGCQGVGEVYYDDRNSPANLNNDGDMNTLVVTGCADPLFDRFAMGEVSIHELFHGMGSVQRSAPHHTNNSHCWDEADVMCYDDDGRPGTFRLQQICPKTVPELLDCKDNDYFDTTPAGGTYLASHWNSARNTFQATGAPARFQPLPAPKIALKSPGSTVSGKVTVPVTVLAPGGGIEQVQFTVNGQKTTDQQAPYSITINTLDRPNGTKLNVSATATDRFGLVATAKPITMTVFNPVAGLLTPASFQAVGQHFTWSASATPAPGHTIQKVELLASYFSGSSEVLDVDSSKPFGGTVADFPRPASFDGTLRVRATQSGGATVTSPARDVLLLGPVVTSSSGPFLGVGTTPVTFLVQVDANPGLAVDSLHVRVVRGFGQGATKVDEFDVDDPLETQGPTAWFAASWPRPNGPQPTAGQDYRLIWQPTDTAGSQTPYPSEGQVSWLGAAHSSVALTTPAAGTTVSGTNVAMVAEPDLNGHNGTYGQIDVDQGAWSWYVDESSAPPWTVPSDFEPDGWDTTAFANGPHLLQAQVFTDESSGTAPSPGTIVTVDNADPKIVVTGVDAGDRVTGQVHLHATLSGLPAGWDGPYRIEFFANAKGVAEDNTPAPLAGDGTWGTAAFDDGRVEVRARASFFGNGNNSQWTLWSAPVVVAVEH
jgi:hypothetical protein